MNDPKQQQYHLRSMKQLSAQTFQKVCVAIGATFGMWHRNYAVITFPGGKEPASLSYAVPDTDDVKGLTVVLPTDF